MLYSIRDGRHHWKQWIKRGQKKLHIGCCILEQNKYGYIYLTTNTLDGKKYIGKRTKPYFDTKYYGSGKHLKRALKKYGKENFSVEILQWCGSEEELNQAEKDWIKALNAQENENFYNISAGGDWGDISKGMSPQEKAEWGEKISKANTGKKRTPEQRKHISDSLKGKPRHLSKEAIERRKGSGNHRYGKHWSEEEKQKLSDCSVTKKKVVVIFNGKTIVFNSVVDCCNYLKNKYGISKFLVKKMLREQKPYKLNGNCKNQEKVRLIEGMVLKYL